MTIQCPKACQTTPDNECVRSDSAKWNTHIRQELVNIYVEVDENQHRTYTSSCELVRLNDIAISSQFRRPLVVVRCNPDTLL